MYTHGKSKWKPVFLEYLKNRVVVVVVLEKNGANPCL
jgi:hypothetical protein